MKILWSEPAELDLESIKEYIARDSDYYACSFVEKEISAFSIGIRGAFNFYEP